MYNHFSVILMCLSGVYCISSKIDNLDWEELNNILTRVGERDTNLDKHGLPLPTTWGWPKYPEWHTTINQNILEENADGSKTSFNIKTALKKFAQEVQADKSALTKFESIRNIIKTGYQCTLAKYASLVTFLVVQEISQVISIINDTVHYVMNDRDVLGGSSNADDLFERKFHKLSYEKYHTDFDVNLEEDKFTIFSQHGIGNKKKWEILKILMDMIEKKLGLNIKHKIYPDVMKSKFINPYDKPRVDVLNKLMCVFNEAIKILDDFIVDKCVQHGGNFVMNFKSLHFPYGHFMWLLNKFDKLKARGGVELYKDFTKTILPAVQPIRASGCFVENLEIELYGLTMNLPNTQIPTTIYGNVPDRKSETAFKIVSTIGESYSDLTVAMVSIRDPTTAAIGLPRSRRPFVLTFEDEDENEDKDEDEDDEGMLIVH